MMVVSGETARIHMKSVLRVRPIFNITFWSLFGYYACWFSISSRICIGLIIDASSVSEDRKFIALAASFMF